jgi:hypothetical protein
MITIFGNLPAGNIELIDQLQEFFEADTVILDWNGIDDKDRCCETTLAITNKKPPYEIDCHAISLEAAQQLLAA